MYKKIIYNNLHEINTRFRLESKQPLITGDKLLKINVAEQVFSLKLVDFVFYYYQSIEHITNLSRDFPCFMSIVYKSCVGEDYYVNGIHVLLQQNTYKDKNKKLIRPYRLGDNALRYKVGTEEPTDDYLVYIKRIADDIKNSKTQFCAFNLTIQRQYASTAHRNMLLFHKRGNDIDIIIFEPHGLGAYYKDFTSFFATDLRDSLEEYFDRVLLIQPDESCPRGIQKKLPYCIMYSYLWLYMILKVIDSKVVDDQDSSWIQDVSNIIYEYLEKYTDSQKESFIISFAYLMIENFLLSINNRKELNIERDNKIEREIYEIINRQRNTISFLSPLNNYPMYLKYIFIQKAVKDGALRKWQYRNTCNEDEDCEQGICIQNRCSMDYAKFSRESCRYDKECESGKCIERRCK